MFTYITIFLIIIIQFIHIIAIENLSSRLKTLETKLKDN